MPTLPAAVLLKVAGGADKGSRSIISQTPDGVEDPLSVQRAENFDGVTTFRNAVHDEVASLSTLPRNVQAIQSFEDFIALLGAGHWWASTRASTASDSVSA
jgi:hypothetical protein